MLHAWLFDMVDRICRIIRRDERPFGGLQVVLSGDFSSCRRFRYRDATTT